jgi:hypothetical protein
MKDHRVTLRIQGFTKERKWVLRDVEKFWVCTTNSSFTDLYDIGRTVYQRKNNLCGIIGRGETDIVQVKITGLSYY